MSNCGSGNLHELHSWRKTVRMLLLSSTYALPVFRAELWICGSSQAARTHVPRFAPAITSTVAGLEYRVETSFHLKRRQQDDGNLFPALLCICFWKLLQALHFSHQTLSVQAFQNDTFLIGSNHDVAQAMASFPQSMCLGKYACQPRQKQRAWFGYVHLVCFRRQ